MQQPFAVEPIREAHSFFQVEEFTLGRFSGIAGGAGAVGSVGLRAYQLTLNQKAVELDLYVWASCSGNGSADPTFTLDAGERGGVLFRWAQTNNASRGPQTGLLPTTWQAAGPLNRANARPSFGLFFEEHNVGVTPISVTVDEAGLLFIIVEPFNITYGSPGVFDCTATLKIGVFGRGSTSNETPGGRGSYWQNDNNFWYSRLRQYLGLK